MGESHALSPSKQDVVLKIVYERSDTWPLSPSLNTALSEHECRLRANNL
jgi:hypothetical protein